MSDSSARRLLDREHIIDRNERRLRGVSRDGRSRQRPARPVAGPHYSGNTSPTATLFDLSGRVNDYRALDIDRLVQKHHGKAGRFALFASPNVAPAATSVMSV